MNFLPARQTGAGRYHVAGTDVIGPDTDARIEYAVRPEDLTLTEPGQGLSATIRVVEPLGAHILVTCDVEGASFRAIIDSDARVKPGDRLNLAPMPDRVRWFDKETGLSVQ